MQPTLNLSAYLIKFYSSLFFVLLFPLVMFGQIDSTKTNLNFNGDFRFRVEQDWNSIKPNGSLRDDRIRLRYRARLGVSYDHKDWVSFGVRLRTGDLTKQQDPHLTLGEGFKEFSTLPLAFEKLYAGFNHKWISTWIGKNTFPFEKQNELFWSDNVFPEGISVSGKFNFQKKGIQSLQMTTGHFIVSSRGAAFDDDSYFQGFQTVTTHFGHRLKLFPSFYYFNRIPNIPDGNETFVMNYSIFHFGTEFTILPNPLITLGMDFLQNVENYENNNYISEEFRNQKQGVISSFNIGNLKKSGDWKAGITITYLERYAAVDFLAQNDWARWDYSSQGSKDGRLTNFKGIELMGGVAIDENMNLKMRCFLVEQIVPIGVAKETGNRFRLDFNIKI